MALSTFIILGILSFFVLRGPFKRIVMGNHLARMTTIFEHIERTRQSMHIGAGGGIDSLGAVQQRRAEAELERGISYLKNFPRHEVTLALVKNSILAERMGRPIRVVAIHRLLEALIGLDVALRMDSFTESYL